MNDLWFPPPWETDTSQWVFTAGLEISAFCQSWCSIKHPCIQISSVRIVNMLLFSGMRNSVILAPELDFSFSLYVLATGVPIVTLVGMNCLWTQKWMRGRWLGNGISAPVLYESKCQILSPPVRRISFPNWAAWIAYMVTDPNAEGSLVDIHLVIEGNSKCCLVI